MKNPLSKLVDKKEVEKMFGKNIAHQLMTKEVFKYSHKGMFEDRGDQRKK